MALKALPPNPAAAKAMPKATATLQAVAEMQR
jgi:hypothetical protein